MLTFLGNSRLFPDNCDLSSWESDFDGIRPVFDGNLVFNEETKITGANESDFQEVLCVKQAKAAISLFQLWLTNAKN